MPHRIICVHGVAHHFVGYASKCWAEAIRDHCEAPSTVDVLEVNWNRRYKEKQADCSCPFPNGWLDASEIEGLGDLGRYIVDADMRDEAVEECVQAIRTAGEGTIHVLGHSLGSVIAYQALHRRLDIGRQVETFVSVGSPLNWELFRPLLSYEVGTEPGRKLRRPPVDQWTNIMDKADFVYRLARGRPVMESFKIEEVDVEVTKQFSCDDCCPDLTKINSRDPLINPRSLCAHLHFFNANSNGCHEVVKALGLAK